MKQANEPKYV